MNRKRIVFLLFFASGCSGLVYEVVWMRLLTLVFGNTVYATAIVLAGFMGGMAIGSLLCGCWADRHPNPLRLYGILEILIGGCALLFPVVLHSLTPLYGWLAGGSGHAGHPPILAQAGLIVAVIAVPAALMGGTLPVLTKCLGREFASLGRSLGLLYGLNTLGAVLGCAAAGLLLIGMIGMQATTWIAVTLNLMVGAAALLLSRTAAAATAAPDPGAAPPEESVSTPSMRRAAVILLGVAGFTALAYEVLWTRVLVFLTGGTTYAFTMMLLAYLSGLAIGSLVAARFIDRSRRLMQAFGIFQALIGIGMLATLVCAPQIFRALGNLLRWEATLPHAGLIRFVTLQTTLTFGFLFPFALLMGISFPVVGKLCAGAFRTTGARIGFAYFADTIGCVAGSLAAGFFIIPRCGTLGGLALMAVLNLFIGAVAMGWGRTRKDATGVSPVRLVAALAVAVLLTVAGWRSIRGDAFLAVFSTPGSRLTYCNEDIGGTVTIEQFRDFRTLSINGVNVAGTHLGFETTQKLQAHLALLLHHDPRRVLQIGFGSGGTAYAITRHPVERIDCVEITAAVLKARDEFREVNHGVTDDPRVRVFIDDARSYLVACTNRYDAILSDSIHPIRAGNGGLYAVDYFRLCRAKLNEDGIFSAWLPIYGLSLDDYRVTVRSLRAVFPHVYLFHTPAGRNEWSIILGLNHPLRFDLADMRLRLAREEVRTDLGIIHITRAEDLLDTFLAGDETLPAFLGPSRVLNTDDFPYLEYVAPLSVLGDTRGGLLLPLYQELLRQREGVNPYVVTPDADAREAVRKSFQAAGHALQARLAELGGPDMAGAMWRELQAALELEPTNPAAREIAARHTSAPKP